MFTTVNSSVGRAVLGAVGTALCAGLCLVAATAPAAAATVRTTKVSYADLDVHTAQGRAALDRRVRDAARIVCSSADDGIAARFAEGRCIHRAVAQARPVAG